MKNVIVLFALVISSWISASGQSNELINISHDKAQRIDDITTSLMKVANLPGISIAIKKEEEIIFAKAYGYSDIEEKREMNISSRLRTASVAKVMTVTALGKLVSEGKLDLDAPISNYVDGLRSDYNKITSRQLAGHLSGMKHRPQKRVKNKLYESIDESLALFMEADLEHKPGTKYKYSTNGYTLLSAVIEGASGMSYLNYMEQEIFQPLGMKNSRPEIKGLTTEEDASLYFQKGSKLKKEKKWANPSWKWAGAGYRTTPSDLVRMMNAYTDGMIDANVVQDIFTTQFLPDGSATFVGVGWRTNIDPLGREWRDHAGNWQGARSVLSFFPQENMSISIMVNCHWQGFIEETAHVIAAILSDDQNAAETVNLQKDISALFVNFKGEEFPYKGKLILENGNGRLKSNSEGFLKDMPLFYLGHGNHYGAVTSYGVMYMTISPEKSNSFAHLYMYNSMRNVNPTNEKPSVTISYRK